MGEKFTGTNGVTYTLQPDGQWLGSNGSSISDSVAQRLRATGDDEKVVNRQRVTFDDGSIGSFDPAAGTYFDAQGRSLSSAPQKPQATTRDKNHGNGVFEDEAGFYVFSDGGPINGEKTYITAADAEARTNPQQAAQSGASAANAAGNLSARWAELDLARQTKMAELDLARQTLDATIEERNRRYALDVQKEAFLRGESEFNRYLGNETLATQKAQQAETVRSNMAQEAISIQGMVQQRNMLQAQMQAQTDQFNASMEFQTQQANAQAKEQKASRLQSLASDISSASKDPGDRAALASYVLANTGFGKAAATGDVNLVTDESLTGLEGLLRNREDVQARPDNPYSFSPLATPTVPEFDINALRNLFGVQQTGSSGGIVNQAAPQAPVERQPNVWSMNDQGTTDTADDQWVGPAVDWDKIRASKVPKMEQGGVTTGAFVAGDDSEGKENREVVIPNFPAPGMTTVVPEAKLTAKMRAHMAKMPKAETGGVFADGIFSGLDSDRTRARDFMAEVNKRARTGTPWATGNLPGLAFESSPGFDPFVADLLQSLRASEQGLPVAWQQRQAAMLAPTGVQDSMIGRSR